ncbi:MAG: hypothetical protein EP330_24510 [Deltaproteobacteria bacterium]|nr:MAG: hypothetical protein EP330_24510 [Deltaproteobacteria bacterium]
MTRIISTFAAALVGTSLLATPALAAEKDGEDCVRTKVWDAYGDGWHIRTLTSTTLANGATNSYLVTVYQGNEYKFEACGDDAASNIDLLLYDLDGNVVHRDDTENKEPTLTLKPETTTTYYLVVYARKTSGDAGVGVAVTYR